MSKVRSLRKLGEALPLSSGQSAKVSDVIAKLSGEIFHADPGTALNQFLVALQGQYGVENATVDRLIYPMNTDPINIDPVSVLKDGVIDHKPESVVTLEQGPLLEVYETGKPLTIPKKLQDRYPEYDLIRELGAVTFVGIPLFHEGSVIGSLSVWSRLPKDLDSLLTVCKHYQGWLAVQILRYQKDRDHHKAQVESQDLIDHPFDGVSEEQGVRAVLNSRADLMTVFDRASVGLAVAEDFKFIQVNPNFAKMMGYEVSDLIGKTPLDVHIPDGREKVIKVAKLLEEGTKGEIRYQAQFAHRDGHIVPAELTLHRLEKEDGSFRGILATAIDLTEQHLSEAALRAAQDQTRTLIDTSPAGIMQLGDDFQVQFVSKRILEIHGIKLSQKVEDFFALVASKDRKRIKEELHGLVSDEAKSLFFESVSSANEALHVQGAARALFDATGKRTGVLLCYADASAEVIANKRLETSQARYRSIVESSPSGISILNEEGIHLYASPRALEIFGEPSPMAPGDTRSVFDYVLPADRARLETFIATVKRAGTVESQRFRAVAADGRSFWVEAYAKNRKSADGSDEITIVHNDITEMLEVEKELENEKAIYQSLISNSFEGIDILEFERSDKDLEQGKILIRNGVMFDLLGFDEDSFNTTSTIANIIPADIHKTEIEKRDELGRLLQKQVVTGSWLIRHGDGRLIYTEGVLRLLEQDDSIFVVRILSDVTEQRDAERTIQNQLVDLNYKKEELERYIESNLQLENFAYIASHDLKAPARSIGSFADLLNKTAGEKLSDRENYFLGIILESSKNMLALIDDLLAYSRLNQQKINVKPVEFEKLLESVLHDLKPQIEDSGAKISWSNLPEDLMADGIKLRQLLLNFLSNSLKFQTEKDEPKIAIDCTSNDTHWIFTISDNGIGIDEKYADKVFLLFQKLHSSDKYEGSGMGLAICKKIVEQHFGRIEVVTQGKSSGATIRFTIAKDLVEKVRREQELLLSNAFDDQ